jgi:hypothetical protein
MGIMKMSQDTFLPLHGSGQSKDCTQIEFALDMNGKDREIFFQGLFMERALWLDDKNKRKPSPF